jgi:hypothetical protein
VGFPLLLAPAYALGGATGVELLLAALGALGVALGYRLALRVVPDPWALGAALAVGLSPPFLAYGTAVYPELTAGAALAGAALLALAVTADPAPTHYRRLFGLWRTGDLALAAGMVIAAAALLAAAVSRHALFGLLAIGVSTAGTFALLEAAGAVGVVSWPALFGEGEAPLGRKAVPHLDVAGTTFQDTAARWGLASEPIAFRYRTDRHGFRNDIDRADADIYLLGDSVLVAALIPFPATVAARLENATRKSVKQIALLGIGAQEEQALFRQARLEVKGRRVIQFIFEDNDLRDSKRFRTAARRAASWDEGTLTRQVVLGLHRLTQPVAGAARLRSCAIGSETYAFYWARESFAGLENEAAAISSSLTQFAGEVRAAGGEFAVVLVPSKLRVLGPLCRFPATSELSDYARHLGPLRDHLRAWSAASGIALLDLTEPMVESARAGRIPWFWGDTHWNEQGHAVAAEALLAWELLWRMKI